MEQSFSHTVGQSRRATLFTNKFAASVLTVVLVASAFGPAAAAAQSSEQQAYAGTHVTFDTNSNAVVDYAVNEQTVMESVKVQSRSEAQNQAGISIGIDISSVTNVAGAAVSLDAKSETSARLTTDSGAEIQAHDNPRGILVIRSGSESQYVMVNTSSSSQVESEGDQRVVVTIEDGTKGTFIVIGDGEVTVNDRGNVSAELGSNSQLVFRSYADGRNDEEKQQEQLIADGKVAAEVYVMQQSEGSGEAVADVVQYSEGTTVEVTQQSEGTVTMTAERSESQGRIIITSVSDAVISSTDDMQVTVDGDAAARVSSYSELESAINNGDSSKFLIRQQSDAEASADVLVAVSHFSERDITMSEDGSSGDGSTTNNGGGYGDSTDTSQPGFGIGVAVVAILAAALFALRRP